MKLFYTLLFLLSMNAVFATSKDRVVPVVDQAWITERLSATAPRLIWQTGDEVLIRKRMAEDEDTRLYYELLIQQADALLKIPVSERIQTGRRLLSISRQVLQRTTMLAFAWRLTGEEAYAERLDAELRAVCGFSDWNPSHFLDVAEMSMAVALGIDWGRGGLSSEVIALSKANLLEKGLKASLPDEHSYWKNMKMNWNQVCHGGMAAAALVCFEEDPELCVMVLNRMLEGLPHVLETYGPDGVYVEGASYWEYGTGYNVLLFSLLESALGTAFEMESYPGFMESADYVDQMHGPSGSLYNFFDCSDSMRFCPPLLWFAMKTGNERYLQRKKFEGLIGGEVNPSGHSFRLGAVGFLWWVHTQAEGEKTNELPLNWLGRSENPLVVFRSGFDDANALYLAAKGGKAALNHGNMDGGSFIFELNGVRWAIDPGNQNYHELEEIFKKIGGSLWHPSQDSRRWSLLTKNNFGHNTLTVDGALHFNEGEAVVTSFDAEERKAVIDLTELFPGKVKSAIRAFKVVNDQRIEIIDEVTLAPETEKVVWQMLTEAEVTLRGQSAILRQGGKVLKLTVKEGGGANISVISLDPPPVFYDKVIPGLKRIEVSVPAYKALDGKVTIDVVLEGITEF